MANKLKTTSKKKHQEKSTKASDKLKFEKEEKVDLKKLARDERTWKIAGTVFLLISIFLFISFISYFFTWKEDFSEVSGGSAVLFDNEMKVSNLLGRLGAYVSHFFIY
mgnify:CR=1 FL=1